MRLIRNTRQVLCLIACLTSAGALKAADWPAYRADNARSATTSEKLQFPLSLAWKYVPSRKHQPAWPDPFLIRGRGKNFDAAPQTVIVGDLVYFGSTTDNTLWALDAQTGKTKWGFTTGGPVRFAPAVSDGRAFVVSDDGLAYCLDAATGKLIWKFRGGLSDRKVVGNGRVISRWPIRSGVAVKGSVVHFATGMWSSEGVYVYALDAKTGKEIWCNDANLHYLPMPHASTAQKKQANYSFSMPPLAETWKASKKGKSKNFLSLRNYPNRLTTAAAWSHLTMAVHSALSEFSERFLSNRMARLIWNCLPIALWCLWHWTKTIFP